MNYKTGVGFTWMLSSDDEYCCFTGVWVGGFVGNLQHRKIKVSIWFAYRRKCEASLRRMVIHQLPQPRYMVLNLTIGVRNRVCYVEDVAAVVKFKIKRHRVIRFWLVWVHLVDFVVVWWYLKLNIITSLKPFCSFFLVFLEAPDTRFHTVVK